MSDPPGLVDQGYDAIAGAVTGALNNSGSAGQVLGGAVGGAVTGAAVGGALSVALPVAGFVVGGAAAAAGATATTSLGIMAAGMAIGSSIPIPVVGTVIGAIAGAIGAVVAFFNNRPSPKFASALLAVFRQYPNVLREWVNERYTFGVPHDHSALRSRWGYVAMLREVAGEKGYDQLEDQSWQKSFELGQVDPKPPAKPPRLVDLGLVATKSEASQAAAALQKVINIPGIDLKTATVTAIGGGSGYAVTVEVQPKFYVPNGMAGPPATRNSKPELYVFGERVPVIQNTTSKPVVVNQPPSAEVSSRRDKLAVALKDIKYVKDVLIVPAQATTLPDDSAYGFAVVVDRDASLDQRNQLQILMKVVTSAWGAGGARNVVVTDEGGIINSNLAPASAQQFPPSAEAERRRAKLYEGIKSMPYVKGVDTVSIRPSYLPDDGNYGFQIRVAADATPADRLKIKSTADILLVNYATGARTAIVVSEPGISDSGLVLAIGGVAVIGLLGYFAMRKQSPAASNYVGESLPAIEEDRLRYYRKGM